MDVPSRPIHLVITISCPGFTDEVTNTSSFLIVPTPVTEINGCFTTSVISVCPPITSIFNWLQADSTPRIISFNSSSLVSGVRSMVSIIPIGSAPEAAKSFAVMCTLWLPISFTVPVIGSVEKTKTSPSFGSKTAQSCPTAGPTNISSLLCFTSFKTERINIGSGNFPIFITVTPVFSSLFFSYTR